MTTDNHNFGDPGPGSGMTLDRFALLAETYGADIERWPDAERLAALTFAARSEAARARLAEAHEVDAMLARLDPPPVPSAALRARVAALGREPAPRFARPARATIARAAGFAMAAAAGLAIGLLLAPPGPGEGGLGLVEAALVAGEAPSIVVGELLELD